MLTKIHKLILDILFPIECLGCKKDDVWLCNECLEKLPVNNSDLQHIDLKPSYLDGFFVASEWENKLLQDVIHKFKYNFAQELAEPLSKLLIKRIHELIHELKDFVIVPVPLHKKRYIWRGFNQAELLAHELAHELGMKIDNKIVSRIKNTSAQVKLSGKDRRKNIQEAFGCRDAPVGRLSHGMRLSPPFQGGVARTPTERSGVGVRDGVVNKSLIGEVYLLIDDVITTGATMNECAKVLKNSNAEKVYGMALARG